MTSRSAQVRDRRRGAGRLGRALAFLLTLLSKASFAQGETPLELTWTAPANCPQQPAVEEHIRTLVGSSTDAPQTSRLRAEGFIDRVDGHARLTLQIHYGSVHGTRIIDSQTCGNLGMAAAVVLGLLVRREHSQTAPLTEGDLTGTPTDPIEPAEPVEPAVNSAAPPQPAAIHQPPAKAPPTSGATLLVQAPRLSLSSGELPHTSYGIGLGFGLTYAAWRVLLVGEIWLPQSIRLPRYPNEEAAFHRKSLEAWGCRSWRRSSLELAPCLLVSLDDVTARGTGTQIVSQSQSKAWLSTGAGLQGFWHLGRSVSLVVNGSGRLATYRPRFLIDGMMGVREAFRVSTYSLGATVGCEWRF